MSGNSEAALQEILAANEKLKHEVEISKNILKVSEACEMFVFLKAF